MAHTRRVRPFTPSKEPAVVLDARTVGRDALLAMVNRRMHGLALTAHRPHTLLIGPRGAGKTHLLEVALHRARQDPDFDGRVVVARFDEDMVGIGRYRHVLLATWEQIDGGSSNARPDDLETAIEVALAGRPLVVVIENLDRLFRSLGESGQQDLRAWIENSRSIMVLATSPVLFAGVSDRNKPWFGNFDIHHLGELDLQAGTTLLTHLAREEGDSELAAFLESERGQARLNVINLLAGGSPRIWMILFDCISVQLLDELTPAVEALMEGLVPYYQQLLWDLSDNEQRIVRTLADGANQSMTVSALAEGAELDQRTTASTLGRLEESWWVRREKPPGTDRRTTWYRLREPLLRHHLHYRSATDQPLTLIVELLRAWFDPEVRRAQLIDAMPGSAGEGLLARSLTTEPHRFDSAYADHDVEALLADARRWAVGEEPNRRTREAGALIEFCVLAGLGDPAAALETAAIRVQAGIGVDLATLRDLGDAISGAEDSVSFALDHLRAIAQGRTRALVELVAVCWTTEPTRAADARRRLSEVLESDGLAEDDLLLLDVREEHAYWTGAAGDAAAARDLFAELTTERTLISGATDHDTMSSRFNLAYWTGEAGDAIAACELFASVVADRTRVLGADHPHTLTARFNLAYWTGEAGDAVAACELFASVVVDRTRIVGADDPDTLTARHNLAYQTGRAGDAAAAIEQYTSLIADRTRVLGADHPDTLSARHNLAYLTGEAGDAVAACELFASVVVDRTRVLGADHPHTLTARHNLAFQTGEAGDAVAACELFASVVADRSRVLGSDHPDTLSARHNVAYWSGKAGDAATARKLYTAVVADTIEIRGDEHQHTLAARHNLAHYTATAGDVVSACEQFAVLAADRRRVSGLGDRGTSNTHIALAIWTARAGRPAAAVQTLMAFVFDQRKAGIETDDSLVQAVGLLHTDYLQAVVDDRDDEVVPDGPGGPLLVILRDALRGDAEAMARVPVELSGVLTELREGRSGELAATQPPPSASPSSDG